MWETLTPSGIYDGQHDMLFWRYVDSEVKDDPSDGWYILMKLLSPSLVSQPESHQSTNIDINYTGMIFGHGIS